MAKHKTHYEDCDVLVVGGGISGIISAKLSAEKGLDTILIDDKSFLGGSTIYLSLIHI